MFELLQKEEVEWSSQTAKPSEEGSRELCFLEQVITPVSDCGHGELWFHIPHNALQL